MSLTFVLFVVICQAVQMEDARSSTRTLGLSNVNPSKILLSGQSENFVSPQTIILQNFDSVYDDVLPGKNDDVDLNNILDALRFNNARTGQNLLNLLKLNTNNLSTNKAAQPVSDADKQSQVGNGSNLFPHIEEENASSSEEVDDEESFMMWQDPARFDFADAKAMVFSPLKQANNKEALDHFVSFLFHQKEIGENSQFRVVMRNAHGSASSQFMEHISRWTGEDITTYKKQFVDFALDIASKDEGKFLAGLLHSMWLARNEARNEDLSSPSNRNRNLYKLTITHRFRDCWRKWFQTQLLGVSDKDEGTKEIVKSMLENATGIDRHQPRKTMSAVDLAGKLRRYSDFNYRMYVGAIIR